MTTKQKMEIYLKHCALVNKLKVKKQSESGPKVNQDAPHSGKQERKSMPKRCNHTEWEPIRWGVETGVMIGGGSQCIYDAEPNSNYCTLHQEENYAKR